MNSRASMPPSPPTPRLGMPRPASLGEEPPTELHNVVEGSWPTLEQLCVALGGVLTVPPEVDERGLRAQRVTGVQQDSRRVKAGEIFVALQGATSDGARFIPNAVEAGALAILLGTDRLIRPNAPVVHVEEPRQALARAAAMVWGRPSEKLVVIGLTGTNGKTTAAQLIAECLRACDVRPGVIGTLGYNFAGEVRTSAHTSPEADELQPALAQMVDKGASHVVMEVSSIALAAERVAEVDFDVAVFTNLTQDHLDYHGSMAAYAAAKDQLFLRHTPRKAVVNVDDPHGARLAKRIIRLPTTDLLRVSLDPTSEAEVRALSLQHDARGIRMDVRTPRGQWPLRSPLLGTHNAANLLSAVAVAEALELDIDRVCQALTQVWAVDGRLERCDDPKRDTITVLVDYAHTPDALERALASVRSLTEGRLWCVFGCGGDRDAAKREPMGAAVARAADAIVITNDNPRSESPDAIAAAIARGVESIPGASYELELNRAKAIHQAIEGASVGDVVLIAGKGHETYQIIGTMVTDFDDRLVARAALAARRRPATKAPGDD